MNNNVVDLLKGVVGELREISKSETIIGHPITIGDKTVVPVVKLTVGFGAGGGQGTSTKSGEGFGGGGGGGARIEPAAFIIMDSEGIRVLPATKGMWDGLATALPEIVRSIAKLKDNFGSDSKGSSDKSRQEPPREDYNQG